AGAGRAAIALGSPHAAMQDDVGVRAASALACSGALMLLLGAPRILGWGVQVSLALGTLLIAGVVHFSGSGNTAFAFYYVWVGIYAFYFFPRPWAIAQATFVAIVYGGLLWLD